MIRNLIIIIVGLLGLVSCHTKKQPQIVTPAPIVLNNTDSVQVKTIIKTEYIPVTVEVPVPQQSVSVIVDSDTSHIETDVAVSNAWLRPDGTLYHDLVNKDTKLIGESYVPQTTTDNENVTVISTETPVPQPYPVYVEKELSNFEKFKMSAFWYLISTSIISIGFIFRKQFLGLMRNILSVIF